MSLDIAVRREWKGFSLDVAFSTHRQMLGILGASGCGKSMTLKCIAGIETPETGRVTANGRVLYDSNRNINLKPQARGVGYLFQNYALFPNMSVEDNIACGLPGVDKSERGSRIRDLIARFRLEGLEQRYPLQLSGGQQQRVALARMLAGSPSVLLLDEPFSALDAYLKEQLQLELLDLLKDYDGDVVMVTHSRDEVYRLCRRLLVLDKGRCIASGNTRDLFRDPGALTVARLTGCKNISRAVLRGERTVYAEDWGLTLRVAGVVPQRLSHVGVRAHFFQPGDGPNAFPIQVDKELESPFEWNVLVRPAGAPDSQSIWWQVNKDIYSTAPDRLHIPPEQILLLCPDRPV